MNKLIKSRLFGNIISLFVLQGSNYLFPLITFPYLVRTLGTEKYGILSFCIAFMSILNILVDYGFNISGTRGISVNKDKKDKVNEIYNKIMTIKIFLTMILGIIYFVIIEFIPFFNNNKTAFLVSFLMVIGNTIFPIWLFQGLERMKYITYFNIIAKASVTILVFILIKNPSDITKAIFLQTLYFIIPGIISLWHIKFKFNIKFKFFSDKRNLIIELINGRHIFMTNLWINVYGQGSLIILGLVSGNNATGNYSIAQRIMNAFYGLSHPIIQAIYPYLCELYEKNKSSFYRIKRRVLYLSVSFSSLIAVFLFVFSSQLTEIVTGSCSSDINNLVRFFSVIVFLGIMNTVMARLMYAMNLQETLNKIYSKAAIIFIIFSIPLTIWLQELGMSIIIIIVETIILLFNVRNLVTSK